MKYGPSKTVWKHRKLIFFFHGQENLLHFVSLRLGIKMDARGLAGEIRQNDGVGVRVRMMGWGLGFGNPLLDQEWFHLTLFLRLALYGTRTFLFEKFLLKEVTIQGHIK